MKNGLALAFLFLPIVAFGQQAAVTDTGEQVYLYSDGTWEYLNKQDGLDTEIPVNARRFQKPESATFPVRSQEVDVDFWIDPQKWQFIKSIENPDAEYEFTLKGEDLYGMVITERVEIAMPELSQIALENMKSLAPNARIIHREYRTINGTKVLRMHLEGKGSGMAFQFIGNYYSDDSGSIQHLVWTGKNLVEEFRPEIEDFLNGMMLR